MSATERTCENCRNDATPKCVACLGPASARTEWQPRAPYVLPAAQEPSGGANAVQVGGKHYKAAAIEPWDYVAANGLGFFEGNAIKYLTRWRAKNGVEDLRKARHYIDKLIELEGGK